MKMHALPGSLATATHLLGLTAERMNAYSLIAIAKDTVELGRSWDVLPHLCHQ